MRWLMVLLLLAAGFSLTKLLLERHAKERLGGDVEVSHPSQSADLGVLAYLNFYGKRVSHVMTMRAEARLNNGKTVPVLLKTFYAPYPLYGRLDLRQKIRPRALGWFHKGHANGMALTAYDMHRLELKLKDRLLIGNEALMASAVIAGMPDTARDADKKTPLLLVASPVFVTLATSPQTEQPVAHAYRVILPANIDIDTWVGDFTRQFAETGWVVHDWREYAPRLVQSVGWPVLWALLAALSLALLIATARGRRG